MPAFVSNGIAYSDDKFIQTTQPEYQMSAGQPSTAVVVFRGPAPKLKDFVSNLLKNKLPEIDFFGAPINKGLYRAHNVRNHPQFPFVELTFDIPTLWDRVTPVDSKRSASAQVTMEFPTAGPPLQIVVQVQYKAPSTTYSWLTNRKPGENPPDIYSKVRFKQNPFDLSSNPRFVVTNTGSGQLEPVTPDFLCAVLKLHTMDSVEDYDIEDLIPGYLWRCTTTVSKILSTDAIYFAE